MSNFSIITKLNNPDLTKDLGELLANCFIDPNTSYEDKLNFIESLISLEHIYDLIFSDSINDIALKKLWNCNEKLSYLFPNNPQPKKFKNFILQQCFIFFQNNNNNLHYKYEKNSIFQHLIVIIPDCENYIIEKSCELSSIFNIPFIIHHQKVYELISQIEKTPNSMDDLITYWKQHENDILDENNYHDFSEFNHEDFGIFNVRDIYLQTIINFRNQIAKKMFHLFLYNSELSKELSKSFPAYFQFTDWLNDTSFKLIHCHFKPEHINRLSQYKDIDGYNYYINHLLYGFQKKDIYIEDEYDTSDHGIVITDSSEIDFIVELIYSGNNWDLLLTNLPNNIDKESNHFYPLLPSYYDYLLKIKQIKNNNLFKDFDKHIYFWHTQELGFKLTNKDKENVGKKQKI